MIKELLITPTVTIPYSELSFRTARSGGKGGQNVNKVETKVELLFNIAESPTLSDEEKERAITKLGARVDSDGVFRLVSQESRSQSKNKELAIERFIQDMKVALKKRKKRVPTKTPASVKEKRLETKKRRGAVKRMRVVKIE